MVWLFERQGGFDWKEDSDFYFCLMERLGVCVCVQLETEEKERKKERMNLCGRQKDVACESMTSSERGREN